MTASQWSLRIRSRSPQGRAGVAHELVQSAGGGGGKNLY